MDIEKAEVTGTTGTAEKGKKDEQTVVVKDFVNLFGTSALEVKDVSNRFFSSTLNFSSCRFNMMTHHHLIKHAHLRLFNPIMNEQLALTTSIHR